jgi:hypothetical protein
MTSETSTTTWETLVEQYRERAARDDARIEELMQRANHWHDTADMIKRQRDQAEKERDALRKDAARLRDELMGCKLQRDHHEKDAIKLLKVRGINRRAKLDTARLDWLADTVAIEAFGIDDVDADAGCEGMDVYEHASIVAEERGNDDDYSASDMREGFRRMIDAAMEAKP